MVTDEEEKECRSPLGLRGLKFPFRYIRRYRYSRSPLGLRGLKYRCKYRHRYPSTVAAHSGCVD